MKTSCFANILFSIHIIKLKVITKNKFNGWAAAKLLLFVPIVAVLLQAFACPELTTKPDDFILVRYTENETEKWLSKWTVDKIGKGVFEPNVSVSDLPKVENNVLVILMNADDRYLVEDKLASKEDIKWLIASFLQGANINGGKAPDLVEKDIPSVGKLNVPTCVVSYKHDVASSNEAVNYTLREIGKAYLEARETKAFILFNKKYFDLDKEKQAAVNEVVPVCFVYEPPKGPKPSVWLPFDGKASPDSKPFNIIMKSREEIYVENHKFSSMEEFYESIKEWNKELKSVNQIGNRVKKFYQANLVVDYAMGEAEWNKLQLAFYRNNIGINKFKKKSGYKVISMSVNEKKSSRQRYKVPTTVDTRDKSKFYVALYNDEDVDLGEIKSTALECLDTKKAAIIEFEEGIKKGDIESVKKVLKKCGISEIDVVSMEKDIPQAPVAINESQPIKKAAVKIQKRLPWIRFSENLIFVNGRECEFSEMNNTLKRVVENEGQTKVELMIFPNSSKARVAQLTAELNKMGDLEIVQKQYTPPPHPISYKLYLYPDKIKVNRKIIDLENVAQLTKEWIEVTGIKKAEIHMPEFVSEERIAALQHELKKGGIE